MLLDGVQQNVADEFEQALDSYSWGLTPGLTAGKLFRFSPTGTGSTSITQKALPLVTHDGP